MGIHELMEELKRNQDLQYKEFHGGIVPGVELIGVRTPVLHRIAKKIAKEDAVSFLETYQKTCYEADVIYGLVLGYAKLTYEERLRYLQKLTVITDNWAVCDLTMARQKWIRANREELVTELYRLWETQNPWKQRIVYVILLDYYLEESCLKLVFQFCEKPFQKEYYVQMAVAWLLSMALVKFPEQAEEYLRNCSLDDFTYNKALQKARESRQVSAEKKKRYQEMKR